MTEANAVLALENVNAGVTAKEQEQHAKGLEEQLRVAHSRCDDFEARKGSYLKEIESLRQLLSEEQVARRTTAERLAKCNKSLVAAQKRGTEDRGELRGVREQLTEQRESHKKTSALLESKVRPPHAVGHAVQPPSDIFTLFSMRQVQHVGEITCGAMKCNMMYVQCFIHSHVYGEMCYYLVSVVSTICLVAERHSWSTILIPMTCG